MVHHDKWKATDFLWISRRRFETPCFTFFSWHHSNTYMKSWDLPLLVFSSAWSLRLQALSSNNSAAYRRLCFARPLAFACHCVRKSIPGAAASVGKPCFSVQWRTRNNTQSRASMSTSVSFLHWLFSRKPLSEKWLQTLPPLNVEFERRTHFFQT